MCIVVNSPPGPRHNKHSFQVSSGTADSSKYGGSMFNDWRQRRSFPPFDGAGKTLLQLLSADRHLPFAINRGADFIHRWSNIYYTRINGNQESPSTTGASTNNKIFTIRSAAVTRWMNSTEKGVAQPKDNNKRGRMSDKGSWWMNISNRRRRRCRLSRDNLLRRKYHSMYRERWLLQYSKSIEDRLYLPPLTVVAHTPNALYLLQCRAVDDTDITTHFIKGGIFSYVYDIHNGKAIYILQSRKFSSTV